MGESCWYLVLGFKNVSSAGDAPGHSSEPKKVAGLFSTISRDGGRVS